MFGPQSAFSGIVYSPVLARARLNCSGYNLHVQTVRVSGGMGADGIYERQEAGGMPSHRHGHKPRPCFKLVRALRTRDAAKNWKVAFAGVGKPKMRLANVATRLLSKTQDRTLEYLDTRPVRAKLSSVRQRLPSVCSAHNTGWCHAERGLTSHLVGTVRTAPTNFSTGAFAVRTENACRTRANKKSPVAYLLIVLQKMG